MIKQIDCISQFLKKLINKFIYLIKMGKKRKIKNKREKKSEKEK